MILPERNFKNPRAEHGFKARTCSIASVGSYVPERILTNADLEKMVETTDEWITTRTGIKNAASLPRTNLLPTWPPRRLRGAGTR